MKQTIFSPLYREQVGLKLKEQNSQLYKKEGAVLSKLVLDGFSRGITVNVWLLLKNKVKENGYG